MDRLIAMQVFVAVADLGSLTAAANKLDMSRSMATRYIAALEHWLGVRLLHRSTRSLGLTSVGNDMLVRCRQIVVLSEDMAALSGGGNTEPHGVIRVASSVSFGQSYLSQALGRYRTRYPHTTTELILTDRTIKLVEERIDLAVEVTNSPDHNLIAKPLGRCASVVCATPDYLAHHAPPVTPNDLVRHNCLNHTRLGREWRFTHRETGERHRVMVSGRVVANDTLVLLNAARAGEGIACLPEFVVRAGLDAGELVPLLGDYQTQALGIYACYMSRRHMPATLRTLLDFLAQDLSASG
ncbi:transcriptional regulator, LysR family [Dickeya chrysanthemi Ech1591]|uniref:Transcriptional regulator, LysR family n=1 Tax=Dickeya chrysanthemi (strain Ech1591) TaxID=561229 RepID=C6CGD4_DICC1|nr:MULTISPECIES: LysR family transcriptional regulator [Dickeya]ACT06703.1 transcriptional regulator, LysR family [Dickeya chrysanthemi Ech1591]TYL41668.1 LysR family transcriptional regulator [Dickeya sp. ws52]WJM84130.1 LysR family transcriptional regulator [Dickeya chrysanthemi]